MMLFGVFVMASCVTEVDDVFNKNASQRAEEAISETKQILEAPANGWRMEYYGATTYGGYNVLLKFEGDSVLVASEKVGDSHAAGFDANGNLLTAKSHYKIEQSQGVVISMDEYNSIFHYFSDPRNADYGSDGDGFDGDFEFRVVSLGADKIELKGKKHDTKIIMYPLDENISWSDYIKSVNDTENFMVSRSYSLELNDGASTVPTTSTYRRLAFLTTGEDGTRSYVYAPFIITPQGYKFYEPVNVNGVEISGFDKADTEDFFYATGNNSVKLVTEVPDLYTTLTTGFWYLTYEDMGTYGKNKWNDLLKKLEKADNGKRARLYYAGIGFYSSKYTGFFMQAGTDSYNGGMNFNAVSGNGSQVKITRDSRDDNNSKNCYESKFYQKNANGIKSAMDPFCGGFGHTFDLSTDNLRHPSYIILTDTKDPTNVIKVWAEIKQYPFGDLDNDKKD